MAKDNSHFFDAKNNWSEIKDNLLACYILPYFQKLLASNRSVHYIDCFSGKGKFDDGKAGSPVIALDARNIALKSRKKQLGNSIYTYFIDKKYANDLKSNLSSYLRDGCIDIISGTFESNIGRILNGLSSQNVFLYIDPYGIKALDSQLLFNFSKYNFSSFEMLINFNSFVFFRDACRSMNVELFTSDTAFNLKDIVEYDPTKITPSKESDSLLTNIVGSSFWKNIVIAYKNKELNGYQAEELISKGYKSNLRNHYKYVLDMPISLKSNGHAKYRMIHVCNHPDGCYLMAQNMQNRDKELAIHVQQQDSSCQLELFESLRTTRVDTPTIMIEDLSHLIEDQLSRMGKKIHYKDFIVNFSNDKDVYPFDSIQKVLQNLEKSGAIKLVRIPEYTENGKLSKFWEEDAKHTLFICKI